MFLTLKVVQLALRGKGKCMRNGSGYKLNLAFAAKKRTFGFAYVMLLMAIAVLGLFASATLQIGSQVGRRDAEQALLTIGAEYERALNSYAGVALTTTSQAANAAANNARGPKTLEELLKDPRNPGVKRHLRQIFADPMTGRDEWGLIKDASGYILGIYSKSSARPIKQTNFDAAQLHFEGSEEYSKWIFGLPAAKNKIKP
jgi:type II secretory pathway pseudopilin PulG